MKMVQTVANPIRTLIRNNAPYQHQGNGGTFVYDQFIMNSVQDLVALENQVFTRGGIIPAVIPSPTADNKYLLESSEHNVQFTNMCNNPIRIVCYWMKPHFDLYAIPNGSLNPDPFALIQQGYGAPIGQLTTDSSPTPLTDLNFSIYLTNLPHYWKIYKRKTVVCMAGCKVDFNQAAGRSVISSRRLLDLQVQNPLYLKRNTRVMVLQCVSQVTAALTSSTIPTTGSLTTPQIAYSLTQKETYHFRAMLDTRPVVTINSDGLSHNVVGTDTAEFMEPNNAVQINQSFVAATPDQLN